MKNKLFLMSLLALSGAGSMLASEQQNLITDDENSDQAAQELHATTSPLANPGLRAHVTPCQA